MKWISLLILVLIGAWCITLGVKNWDWFFDGSFKMRNLVKILGRNGARAFYIIGGAAAVIIAVVLLFIS